MTDSAFSSSAQAAIQRPVILDKNETRANLSAEQFDDHYELEWTAKQIISKGYKRVSVLSLSPRYGHDRQSTVSRFPFSFQTNFCRILSQFITS
jgi:hypothetical protein